MRIVFHALGTRGDVHPLLALAVSAKTRGHDPVVCAPPDFDDDAGGAGVEFVGVGGRADDLLEHRNDPRTHVEQVRLQVEGLVETASGADLVVGTGVPLAGPTAAEMNRCPYRYFAQAPDLVESTDYVVPLFPFKRLPRLGRIAVNGGFNVLWMLLYGPPLSAARKRMGLDSRWRDSLDPFRGDPPMVLACDKALGPLPPHAALPTVQTAAIQYEPARGLSEHVVTFLDRNGPAIYLGFGSMHSDGPGRTLTLAEPIHRSTGLPVLVRGGAEGAAEDPEWLLRVGDEPHGQLFPRCCAVVHHGGAGTLTTAARCGVPQVIVPHLADQFLWAYRVEELGIGARVGGRGRIPERLAEATAGVVSSSRVATRVAELADEIGHPDGAVLTLDALLT